MAFGKKKKSGVQLATGYDDTESLVTTSGVITALVLAFVCPLLVQFDENAFDRVNFREAFYDWPNRDYQDFLVHTMKGVNGFNWTTQLTENYVFDALPSIVNYKPNSWSTQPQRRSVEMALELVWQSMPIENLRMFLYHESDITIQVCNRGQNFYLLLSLSTSILILSLIGSIALYLSLALSPAREDETGAALARWNKWGLGATMSVYLFNLVALITFLVGMASAVTLQDQYIYHSEKKYAYLMYFLAIPGFVLYCFFAAFVCWDSSKKQDNGEAVDEGEGVDPATAENKSEGVDVAAVELAEKAVPMGDQLLAELLAEQRRTNELLEVFSKQASMRFDEVATTGRC